MAQPWSQVASSPQYQALPADQREAARQQYFSQVIAPQLPDDNARAQAKQQFDAQFGSKGPDFSNVKSASQTVQEAPSLGDQAVRSLSLAGRNVAHGLASIPDIVLAPVTMLANKGLEAAGAGPQYRFGTAGDAADMALNAAGVPNPQDLSKTERFVSAAERGLAGAAGGIGVGGALAGSANPTVSAVGNIMASNPAMQGTSAITGGLSSQGAKEAGAGPVGQIAAGLVGGLAPAAPAIGQAAVQGALRGGEAGRQVVAQNIADFANAGTVPTVGQATQRPLAQGAESLLSKTPGSVTVMKNAAQRQGDQVSDRISKLADSLSPGADSGSAGQAIVQGVSGPGGFVDRFKQQSQNLYNKLDQYVPSTTPVDIGQTKQTLADINAAIAGAKNTSALMQNPKLVQLEQAIAADTQGGGTLPYDAVKKIRSMIGDQLSDFQLTSDLPRSKLKALYGALSDDMKQAAQNAGPQAKQAWEDANAFYKSGQERIDTLQRIVDKNGGPESVFSAATAGTKEGNTTIENVMRSLQPDQQKVVSAAMINRLGKANPSQQNAAGDQFNMGTFLTNWNKLSPQAKSTLFDGYGPQFSKNMDSIAKVASNIREGSQYLSNPSGTAPAGAQITALTGLMTSLFTGHPGVAAGIAGAAGTANLAARLMTNPTFVKFLATKVDTPVQGIVPAIAALRVTAKEKKDPDLKAAADLMSQSVNQSAQP